MLLMAQASGCEEQALAVLDQALETCDASDAPKHDDGIETSRRTILFDRGALRQAKA